MDTLRPTGAAGGNGEGGPSDAGGAGALVQVAAMARAPDHRLADALAGLTAFGVAVDMRLEPDGRVAVVMPAAWASLYLSTIQMQAEAFRVLLHKADTQARTQAAEEHVRSGAPAREWEREQAAIFAEYRRLVGDGVSHREALHRLKAQAGERFTITDLEEVVRAQGAKVRRAERAARAERIREGAGRGAAVEKVAEREGLGVESVKACVRRGSVPDRPRGARADQRARRAAILALHAEGMMPREIVARTGLTLPQIMMAIKGVPRGTARPGAPG